MATRKQIVSTIPPYQEPFLDASMRMTLSWRRFLESQWQRSGGFTDDIYISLFANLASQARFNEIFTMIEAANSEIAGLRALVAARPNYEDELKALRIQIATAQQSQQSMIQQLDIVRDQSTKEASLNRSREAYNLAVAQSMASANEQSIEAVAQELSVLTTTNVPEGTNLYYTDARARASISVTGGLSYNSGTGVITSGTAAGVNTGTSGATIPLLNAGNTWGATQTFTVAPVFTDGAGSRTALGLGTSATVNTGTSGATIPLLNGTNTWSGTNTFASTLTVNAVGTAGGRVNLKAGSGSTMSGDLLIDTNGDEVRIYESGGTNRGANLDIGTCNAGAGSKIALVGAYTATPGAITGYITITDSGGTVRNVAVI
jgi:hypothetical protein